MSPRLFQFVLDLAKGLDDVRTPLEAMQRFTTLVNDLHIRAVALIDEVWEGLPEPALVALRDEEWLNLCKGLRSNGAGVHELSPPVATPAPAPAAPPRPPQKGPSDKDMLLARQSPEFMDKEKQGQPKGFDHGN